MQAFEYASPATLKEAVALLGPGWNDAAVLAGGTDLLALMKDYVESPRRVVSIRAIAGLNHIRETAAGAEIGALVAFEEMLANRKIREEFPALAEAAEGVSSPQIRNMGTIAGDLCQRPRCWYYRGGFGLLALDQNGKSLVAEGDNRYHAIFGNSGPAKFVSPSSLGPALVALSARVRIEGPRGAREIPADNLFVVPQKKGEREHAIAPDEIVTAIVLPASARRLRCATHEVRQKEALDWPLATASVALEMRGAEVRSAHIILGHVAPKPWRAAEAEKSLAGKALDEENAARAGDAAITGAAPLSRNGYKVQLVRVVVKRALLAVAQRLHTAVAKEGGA